MSFGIDALKRVMLQQFLVIEKSLLTITEILGGHTALLSQLERKSHLMATRQELDAIKQQLAQAIQDATTRVQTDIQALRDQLATGNPVTDQDLADLQNDLAQVQHIDPAAPPPPSP